VTDFTICPHGHKLPHTTAYGNCTPLKCADRSTSASIVKRAKGGDAIAVAAAADSAERDEDKKLQLAQRAHEKLMKFLKIPDGLEGDAAERFADARLSSLLPVAVGILEDQLKHGSRDEKRNAAKQILESNGRGKREAIAASSPPIVIQVSGGGVSLPWRQEKEVQGQVVVETKPASKS